MHTPSFSSRHWEKIIAGPFESVIRRRCSRPPLEPRSCECKRTLCSDSARRRRGGFSLVEITMAIGIVSFAFVAVLGLLPSGLNTFRKAMDASVSSQIFQRVINEAQQTDFNTLVATPLPDDIAYTYYDDQGNKVDATDKAKATTIYSVKTRVQVSTTLPGSGSGNTDLATVTVQIANNPGHATLTTGANGLWDANSGVAVSTQSTLVARNTSINP